MYREKAKRVSLEEDEMSEPARASEAKRVASEAKRVASEAKRSE